MNARIHRAMAMPMLAVLVLVASAVLPNVASAQSPLPIQELSLTSVCSNDPAVERRWQITNPNTFEVPVTWQVLETNQTADLVVPSGDSYFFTQAVLGENIVVIVWADEFGVAQSDVATGGVECLRGACFVGGDDPGCTCETMAQYLCEAAGGTYGGDDSPCDGDADGVLDCADHCLGTPVAEPVDADGCACSQLDRDGDGVSDCVDNCPDVANATQSDIDDNGIGDACDPDRDGDGIPNQLDNCPDTPNPSQADLDGDGFGDACDDDRDGDNVPDGRDNCPDVSNPTQAEADGDGVGDACDPDRDGDGVPNSVDNCPDAANPDQADTDGDGLGDECDGSPTGDPQPGAETQPEGSNGICIPFLWQSLVGLPLCGPGCLVPPMGMMLAALAGAGRRRRRRHRVS